VTEHEQPIDVGNGLTATYWQACPVPASGKAWTGADLAGPLRQLHQLDSAAADLRDWDPFATAQLRLDSADPTLGPGDLQWLRDQWEQTQGEYQQQRSSMPMGVVHGDAHVGNLLTDSAGRTVLCDLDSTGFGPCAWDLTPAAVGAIRFGNVDFHQELANAYGSDVTEEPSWPLLSRIRELVLVTSAIPNLASRPEMARKHAHRLQTLRAGDATARWERY
jgi:Ser/Thr protein kinase RdoA (MazF antagonist)